MAIGFHKRPLFGGIDIMRPGGGIGGGIPQEPEMGDMPANVAPLQKRGGMFGRRSKLWDVLGSFGDAFAENGPVYAQQKMARQNALMEQERAHQQAMQRQQDKQYERDDWLFKQQWERDNPKPVNNDTLNDFNLYKSWSPEERALYHQMKPVVSYMADGTPRVVNPYEVQKPNMDMQPVSEDGYDYTPGPGGRANPANWKKAGGQSVAPAGGFQY